MSGIAGKSRRSFLHSVSLLTAAGLLSPQTTFAEKTRSGGRAKEAQSVRRKAAELTFGRGFPDHATNGDEVRHDPVWVCFSKGLAHTPAGEAERSAMNALLHAIRKGDPHAFEHIPLGGYYKLANPQAAFAFDLIGPDSHQPTIVPPPAFSSAEQAAELVELYWHAALRDVPFAAYDEHPLVEAACKELTGLGGFKGPREAGRVTPRTLFRGETSGGLRGPYVSQFLLRDLPWTPISVPQRIRTAAPGDDHILEYPEWLRIQNGGAAGVNDYVDEHRYILTGRDLTEYVHRDFTYQAFLGACLILFRMSAPIDGGVPYHHSVTQSGFVTFGPSDILHLVALVANVALKAAWHHKWVIHRRLRPEEYAARVHQNSIGAARYPLHMDIHNSEVLDRTRKKNGTALLPQAYPEGSPMHPSYPAGHAVIAGACATALKACFAETFIIPNSSFPQPDGQTLHRTNDELTVGGELDKLAENIAIARNFAGIHWRTDGVEGLKLGEAVAIEVLRETKLTSNETFAGYALTRFDGSRITI